MAWVYLGALTLVLCPESAAVCTRRLWPGGITAPFTDDGAPCGADRRAYASCATAAAHEPCEEVTVDSTSPPPPRQDAYGPAAE
ncbi:hypothetical protein [Kitasatospora sp. NPDC059599]|uniref:hypothetical protein n=1 Tax=Kitasatospora sp. NPDC059599 TaxID=3346880 RepID=UPI00367B521C